MTNKVLLIFFLFTISSPSLSKDINTECKEFIKNSEISENNANQKEKLLFDEELIPISKKTCTEPLIKFFDINCLISLSTVGSRFKPRIFISK